MIRITRLRPAVAPSAFLLALTIGLVGLMVLSFAVQRPYEAGADATQRLLGWARAGLFTAGAAAFAAGLAMALRGGREQPAPTLAVAVPLGARPLPTTFTLVALGRTAEDTRAIADTDTADEAIRLMREWSEDYPSERIVIFNTDAEPIAIKRPHRAARRNAA